MPELPIRDFSMQEILSRIESPNGLQYARFGDGAFYCLRGDQGQNCDGVIYTPDQAVALLEVILNPNIIHGMAKIGVREANASQWLVDNKINIEWVNADTVHDASDNGTLRPFVECISNYKIILVGAKHLTRLRAFPIHQFIGVHPTHAFEEVPRIYQEIVKTLKNNKSVQAYRPIVLLSAGQAASPTLVSLLSREDSCSGVSVLDIGSIWDPYVGVLSRKNHRQVGHKRIRELGKLNFNKNISSWWVDK